ncbi:MAG: hypothetical protein ACRCXL_11180 [Dermatophilaceae bacterium]
MRWEALFDDLEGQLAAEARRVLDGEVAERTRRERALVGVEERFASSVGTVVRLGLVGGARADGEVRDHGDGWVLFTAHPAGHDLLVPLASVATVGGLSEVAAPAGTARRFGLGYAVRALARDRAAVAILLRGGGSVLGTIDVVGADYLTVAEHAEGEARRRGNVRGMTTVPFGSVLAIESRRRAA